MGKKNADEMLFRTKDKFAAFISALKDRPISYTMFMTLYYTSMREGGLLTLISLDIDFDKDTLIINKSYRYMNGRYMDKYYGLQPDARLFPNTKSYLYYEIEYVIKQFGVKRTRACNIHYSHASSLVEIGFSPLLIAE